MRVDCVAQFMRTSVADGDAETVRMLIDAKANVNKRGSDVSACIYGVVRLLCMCFACEGKLYLHHAWLIVLFSTTVSF